MNRAHIAAAVLFLIAFACHVGAQWTKPAIGLAAVAIGIEVVAWILWIRGRSG